jgi:predicted O-methyltransferase YrrM
VDPVEVDRRLNALLVEEDGALRSARDCGLPQHEVAPNQGKLLQLLAQAAGAQRILEIGTLGGYSTLWLARSGAHVTTLEANPEYAAVARTNLQDHDVTVLEGPALTTLQTLEGPFDLVFIDADKDRNDEYLDHALRLSRPGTLIVADNVIRHLDKPGVQRFFDRLATDPRLTATALQTVGAKGHDGFALALVLSPGP